MILRKKPEPEQEPEPESTGRPRFRLRCDGCRFFAPEPLSAQDGRCRYYPPARKGGFPYVLGSDWCARFLPIVPKDCGATIPTYCGAGVFCCKYRIPEDEE